MTIEILRSKYKTYQEARLKAVELRNEWPTAKEIISKTLTKVRDDLGMNAEIKVEAKMEGLEIVYLSFGKTASGIFEKIGDTTRPIIKEGGHLFYTQIYNGQITVWKTLPNIEKLMDPESPEQLGKYSPSQITERIVMEHIAEFLDDLATWEDHELNSKGIGYRTN